MIDTNTNYSYYSLLTEYFAVLDTVTFGQEGIFFAAIMIGTISLMGIGTLVGSFLFMILGIVGSIVIGIMSGFNLGMVYWILMLMIIILFMIKKKGN